MSKKTTFPIVIALVAAVVIIVGLVFWNKTKLGQNQNLDLSNDIVKIMNHTQYGSYLTDGKGMTLYFPKNECSGDCLEKWTPYVVNPVTDIKSDQEPLKLINLVKSSAGGYQYAYGDKPLYYFSGDTKPGDINGNNIDQIWSIVGIQE